MKSKHNTTNIITFGQNFFMIQEETENGCMIAPRCFRVPARRSPDDVAPRRFFVGLLFLYQNEIRLIKIKSFMNEGHH